MLWWNGPRLLNRPCRARISPLAVARWPRRRCYYPPPCFWVRALWCTHSCGADSRYAATAVTLNWVLGKPYGLHWSICPEPAFYTLKPLNFPLIRTLLPVLLLLCQLLLGSLEAHGA